MDYYDIIAGHFQANMETIAMSVDNIAGPLQRSSELMTSALLADGKLIACGNGPDAALAQLFVSNLLGRFEQERPALPAIALTGDSTSMTAIAQHSGFNDVFSRPLRALGNAGDVLLCIQSGPGGGNLLRAVQAAHERNMRVVLMSNSPGEELLPLMQGDDVVLRVDTPSPGQSLTLLTMAIQCLCELIDRSLFGDYSTE